MRNETWVIAAPRTLTTSVVANAADAAAAFGEQPGAGDGPITRVVVALTGGTVRVEAHDRADVELDVTALSDRPVVARLEGETFSVSYDFSGVEGLVDRFKSVSAKDSADVVVRVPRAATVKVTTVRSDVSVQDVEASVSVTTASGSAEAVGISGPLSLTTASGRAAVTRHAGRATVRTVSGSAHVAGTLTRVDAQTVSGDVALELAGASGQVTTKTVSGRISVRVAPETGIDLRARTVTGTASFDGERIKGESRTAQITRDEPGATLFVDASTVSGDITVSHTL
ncbi:hypothetical protein Sked_09520 [Sanguibacter keddieii DSM 10542]|uniref:DUF4097 domain-containing protein n=1 Tax=Sanguibacter keddieii (strain ATCC 51767 / DSM 10542 / NCFB 3025 / ST-74) TaxID=446469 RepID=D1BCQ4_SANKS|nr:DUF4097 family beta strand repeat-containing protein [Sanguibacter keddieii]ACZ20902.1 hypothetical protein Sked_09520 [Sanguibacter keddieii DSM 10542]